MDSFNESVFDLFDGVAGDGQPGTHISTMPPSTSSGNAGTTAGISVGSFFGACIVIAGVLVALRRRIDWVADLCDRIVTVFEALTWRQGSGSAANAPAGPPAAAAPAGPRNLSDDSLIALRRLASQCNELRPDEEYV